LRTRAGVLALVLLGSVVLTTPALATTEKYSLTVPERAGVATKLSGIKGYCAGDGFPAVVSDAFVGGKAKVTGSDMFTAEAEMVSRPGYYFVYLVCANSRATVDDVTVY
jgi:hypothetical protein